MSENWEELGKHYNFQPKLTEKLDELTGDFSQATINEIVLWKVNRYAELPIEIIDRINAIPRDEHFRMEDAGLLELLNEMLSCHGIRLPMASTILRFRNPHAFQIIDQRVYRYLYGKNLSANPKPADYIAYLNDLRDYCLREDIPFTEADRLLYEADKKNPEPLARYGAKSKVSK